MKKINFWLIIIVFHLFSEVIAPDPILISVGMAAVPLIKRTAEAMLDETSRHIRKGKPVSTAFSKGFEA